MTRFVAFVFCAFLSTGTVASRQQEERFETCRICGSTRSIDPVKGPKILYRSSKFNHGRHEWQSGIDLGVPKSVPFERVVLDAADRKWGYKSSPAEIGVTRE